MNAGELCIRTVVIARANESLVDAARRMAEQHVGDLVVVDKVNGGNQPVGIVTDRDLVVLALSAGEEPVAWSLVSDVMTPDPVVARESDDVASVLKQMKLNGVRRIPVTDARGDLVGIITADDILEWLGEQMNDLIELVQQESKRERRLRPSAPAPGCVGPE